MQRQKYIAPEKGLRGFKTATCFPEVRFVPGPWRELRPPAVLQERPLLQSQRPAVTAQKGNEEKLTRELHSPDNEAGGWSELGGQHRCRTPSLYPSSQPPSPGRWAENSLSALPFTNPSQQLDESGQRFHKYWHGQFLIRFCQGYTRMDCLYTQELPSQEWKRFIIQPHLQASMRASLRCKLLLSS